MKKALYIIAMATAVVLASCSRDEGDLFDQSAAERLSSMQEAVANNLTGSTAGWELRYFPTEESAGYAYLLRFNKDESVVVAAKNKVGTNNAYKEETGLWTMDGTQGCVISLRSFINIFSIFAGPGSDGVGYSGDYEFVVLENTPSKIRLKGKKHGAYMEMYPLPTGQDWKAYFKEIDYFNDLVFNGNEGIDMTYEAKDTTIIITYDEGVFTYEGDGVKEQLGFVLTPSGLHFYSGCPLKGGGKVRDFVINTDATALLGKDAEATIVANYTASDFFTKKFENKARWIIVNEDTDPATQAAIQDLKDLVASNGAILSRIGYEKGTNKQGKTAYYLYVGYTVDNVYMEGNLSLSYKAEDGTVSFSYMAGNNNLNPLLKRINSNTSTAAKQLAEPFWGTFVPSSYTGSTLNMAQMYLTSETKKLHVVADNELY